MTGVNAYKKAAKRELTDSERSELIERFSPLVKISAYRLIGRLPRHLVVEDLVSCGTVGLMEAVNSYDPNVPVKFETYAKFRIRGAMLDELRLRDFLPRSVRAKMREIDGLYRRLAVELNHSPDDREMAEALKMNLEEYYNYIVDLQPAGMMSYEEVIGSPHSAGLDVLKFLEDKSSPHPDLEIEMKELKSKIVEAITKLDQEEQLLMSLYYYEGLTFTEIADILNTSDQRVCQMHSRALMRLRWRLDAYRSGDSEKEKS